MAYAQGLPDVQFGDRVSGILKCPSVKGQKMGLNQPETVVYRKSFSELCMSAQIKHQETIDLK